MIKCVVLSTQRSGSTLLTDYLSSGDGFLIHSELFQVLDSRYERENEPRHYKISYERYRRRSLIRQLTHKFARKSLIEKYLTEIYRPTDEQAVVGMKLMYGQVDRYPEVMPWLRDNDVRFIHLIRENSLDMIVSRELAAARGTHSMLKDLPMVRLKLEPDNLLQELDRCAQEIEHFRSLCSGFPCHEVTYEAFVDDMATQAKRILDFLGLPAERKLSSVLKKTNPNAKADTIENWDEVVSALEGSKFKAYLG